MLTPGMTHFCFMPASGIGCWAHFHTPTFSGIASEHVGAFVVAQCAGAVAALVIARLLGLTKHAAG